MSKILLIEDDPVMFRMYKRVFTIEGFNVDVAEDGQEGYDKALELHPDIILLDVMMPKMNGLQTLEKLKLDPKTKDIPVIMLTNLANKKDAQSALDKGALKYLIKSDHEAEQIIEVIKDVLRMHSS